MHTKLTLRLGETLITQAKKQARKNGKSLSQMVGEYFQSLAARFKSPSSDASLTPLVAALKGSLRGARVGIKDYRRHLEEKYL